MEMAFVGLDVALGRLSDFAEACNDYAEVNYSIARLGGGFALFAK